MLKLFANIFWLYTPGFFQKYFSMLFSGIFKHPFSRFFISPYCLFFGLSSEYLDLFESEKGLSSYFSYSDFFKRKYKNPPPMASDLIWPCEGFVCDWGSFSDKNFSKVKGQNLDLNTIFNSNPENTRTYFFTNIFLHNHNYHRVHSPIKGHITKITKIPGDLIFLRPWFYKRHEVSYPAFKNERIIFEITDSFEEIWYLAMVGGFGVGTIEISRECLNGGPVHVGQEIAKFDLGSTVCLATPCKIQVHQFLETVSVGQKIELNS